jgi:hypothetical protein
MHRTQQRAFALDSPASPSPISGPARRGGKAEFDVAPFLPVGPRRELLRPKTVLKSRYPVCRTTLWGHAKSGLIPPPIGGESHKPDARGSSRVAFFVGEELDAVAAARIAGASDSDIRRLVKMLVETRRAPRASRENAGGE